VSIPQLESLRVGHPQSVLFGRYALRAAALQPFSFRRLLSARNVL
jgi:hypothetical protein